MHELCSVIKQNIVQGEYRSSAPFINPRDAVWISSKASLNYTAGHNYQQEIQWSTLLCYMESAAVITSGYLSKHWIPVLPTTVHDMHLKWRGQLKSAQVSVATAGDKYQLVKWVCKMAEIVGLKIYLMTSHLEHCLPNTQA